MTKARQELGLPANLATLGAPGPPECQEKATLGAPDPLDHPGQTVRMGKMVRTVRMARRGQPGKLGELAARALPDIVTLDARDLPDIATQARLGARALPDIVTQARLDPRGLPGMTERMVKTVRMVRPDQPVNLIQVPVEKKAKRETREQMAKEVRWE